MTNKTKLPTSIRLSDKMLKIIKDEAEKSNRSISRQIEYMLFKYISLKNDIRNE